MFIPLTTRLPTPTRNQVATSLLETETLRCEWECTRKKRHGDYGAAAAEARGMTRETGIVYEVYACDFCGTYHVGRRG